MLVKAGGVLGRLPRMVGRALLDTLYPPLCLNCEAAVVDADGLCATCFAKLRPITAPLCPRLGIPFQISLGPDALSAEAIADPPPFDRSRSAVLYNEVARTIVSRMKYGDRPELARFCGRLMAGAGGELWAGKPILLPVPLHPLRHIGRRYNQSLELARVIGQFTGLAVDPELVRRKKPTRQQVGLSAEARTRNVAGAFAAHPELLARTKGRPVVIVDDVITTGSTINAVTKALQKAGVGAVDVISFARVVPGHEAEIGLVADGGLTI
ncbi:MAG TPA: ComF family protein [Devosiaceae bacterium]|nr:ComF family protein [Devosiaceae bacterium]